MNPFLKFSGRITNIVKLWFIRNYFYNVYVFPLNEVIIKQLTTSRAAPRSTLSTLELSCVVGNRDWMVGELLCSKNQPGAMAGVRVGRWFFALFRNNYYYYPHTLNIMFIMGLLYLILISPRSMSISYFGVQFIFTFNNCKCLFLFIFLSFHFKFSNN